MPLVSSRLVALVYCPLMPAGPRSGLSALIGLIRILHGRGMRTAAPTRRHGTAARPRAMRRAGAARRALVTLELMTGATGLAGGVLLAAAPDGSLLRADPAALAGTPFTDWRVPGVLLAGLVGGGFVLTGWWQWRGGWHARELSMAAGAGLVCFEAAELAWLGFQPLEAVFAIVGGTVTVLAWRLPRPQP